MLTLEKYSLGVGDRFAGTAERKAGLVGTIPLHRMGTPDEIAEAIVLSEDVRSSSRAE